MTKHEVRTRVISPFLLVSFDIAISAFFDIRPFGFLPTFGLRHRSFQSRLPTAGNRLSHHIQTGILSWPRKGDWQIFMQSARTPHPTWADENVRGDSSRFCSAPLTRLRPSPLATVRTGDMSNRRSET